MAVVWEGLEDSFSSSGCIDIKDSEIGFGNNDADAKTLSSFVTGTVATSSGPKIEINCNGRFFPNGSNTPIECPIVPPDCRDFGIVTVGGPGVVRTCTIRNTGDANLLLGPMQLPKGFSLVAPPTSPVPPGGTTTFQVRFDTDTVGTKGGWLMFAHNGGDENPFSFYITGTVIEAPAPEIAVTGNGINIDTGDSTPNLADGTNFGTAMFGGAGVVRTFTIENTGNADLHLEPIQLPAGFTLVTPPTSPVPSGDTTTFQVRLDTAIAGTKSGWLMFTNSDSDEDPFSFYITGTVSPAPDLSPPTARLATISRISAGKRAAFVVVEYADAGGINLQSIDNNDVRVLRTGRPAVPLQRSSVLSLNGGTLVRAKYALPPIGGTWESSDNGTYTIWLLGRQVTDTAGNAAPKTKLGVFKISLGAAKASRAAAAEPAPFPAPIAGTVRNVSDRFSARPIVADLLSPSALGVDDEPRAAVWAK